MEDVTKALLMAAGMFLAVLILSALVVFYNQISAFYTAEHEATVIAQTKEFNSRFENFHRNNIRGSELISLMNRVIDYNATQSYLDGTNYKRIRVKIHIGAENVEEFKYQTNGAKYGSTNKYITADITNTNGNDWQNDKKLIEIANTSTELCEKLKSIGVTNPTDTQLQQLSSNASSIILGAGDDGEKISDVWAIEYRIKRADLIKRALGINIEINQETGITKPVSVSKINDIKDITSQYYQYTQFKRAYFDCVEVKYDSDTNRVEEMNFKLQTKDGKVVFD